MRGVGKSVLAAAYARQRRSDYRVTWWVKSEHASTLRADFVSLGVRLGWLDPETPLPEAVDIVVQRLSDEGEGILLIFDAAPNTKALQGTLPSGGGAHLLITSNSPSWRRLADPLAIDVWPSAIGADYLVKRTGRETERADAEGLARDLEGLPLAHEQAAAYCEELEVTIAEYRRRFMNAPLALMDDKDYPAPGYHGGRTTVAKTFALAIDAAAELHPGARPLIVHAALLPAAPVPLFLFLEGRGKLAPSAAEVLANGGFEKALAALRTFALVNRETVPDERDGAVNTDILRLHSLVRLVAGQTQDQAEHDEILRGLIHALAFVYPRNVDDDPQCWVQARRLDELAMGLCADPGFPFAGTEGVAGYVCAQLAAYRSKCIFAYDEAEALYQKALHINEATYGPDHVRVAAVLNNLASILQSTGHTADAETLLRRALHINEAWYGPEHGEVAAVLNNLADCLERDDRFPEAERLYRSALAINEKVFGPAHRAVARSLNNLAELLRITNRLTEAETLYRRMLDVNEAVLAAGDPELAVGYANLATFFSDINRYGDALALYAKALEANERTFGPEHPEVSAVLQMYGNCLRDSNRLNEAEHKQRRALAIRELADVPWHPDVAMCINDLAETLMMIGKQAEAEALLARARSILEQSGKASHHQLARVLTNSANLLCETGRWDDAEGLYLKALAIDEDVFGSSHPRLATDLNNLGTLKLDMNRPDEAEPFYRRALAIDEASLGADHCEVATDLNNLAVALKNTNRLKDAEPCLRRALKIYEGLLDLEHPLIAGVLCNLGEVLRMTNRPKEAARTLRRALGILLKQTRDVGVMAPNLNRAINGLRTVLTIDLGFESEAAQSTIARAAAKYGLEIDEI